MNEMMDILILEDDKNDSDLLQHELKRSGFNFKAIVVQDKKGYMDALESIQPDIILSDYSLPSFDGMKAFILKQEKYPDIPFIIVSGTIGEENAVDLIKNGVTDYLLKDKLFALGPRITRAMKEASEKKEKRVTDEALKAQYKKLLEIASIQSHQVRAPVASILGLINLFNYDNPGDPKNVEILLNLKKAACMFDQAIHEIVTTATSPRSKTDT